MVIDDGFYGTDEKDEYEEHSESSDESHKSESFDYEEVRRTQGGWLKSSTTQ